MALSTPVNSIPFPFIRDVFVVSDYIFENKA